MEKQEFASTSQVLPLSSPPTPPSLPHPDPAFSGAPDKFSPLPQALWESQQPLPSPCQARIFLTLLPHKVTVTLTSRHGTESHQTHPHASADALGTEVALEAAGVARENGTGEWHRRVARENSTGKGHGRMAWENDTGKWHRRTARQLLRGVSPALCSGLCSAAPHPGPGLCLPRARLKAPRAPPGTAPRPCSHGQMCTAGRDRACPSAPLDLTAGLAELAAKS